MWKTFLSRHETRTKVFVISRSYSSNSAAFSSPTSSPSSLSVLRPVDSESCPISLRMFLSVSQTLPITTCREPYLREKTNGALTRNGLAVSWSGVPLKHWMQA